MAENQHELEFRIGVSNLAITIRIPSIVVAAVFA